MTLPDGIKRTSIGDRSVLATSGAPVGSEPVQDGWRAWEPDRSKVSAMIELGMNAAPQPGETVLYLGAAAGTTASHVVDVTEPVYAIEFAPRPARELVNVAEDRERLIPLLKDARRPKTYAHIIEADIDLVIQDVATRGQAAVAKANRRFLADDGRLVLAVKARSEDVTAAPAAIYEQVREGLRDAYDIVDEEPLDRYHNDHLGIVATPT